MSVCDVRHSAAVTGFGHVAEVAASGKVFMYRAAAFLLWLGRDNNSSNEETSR